MNDDYQIIGAASTVMLQNKVNRLIEKGFFPVGGPFVSQESISYLRNGSEDKITGIFCQAMLYVRAETSP